MTLGERSNNGCKDCTDRQIGCHSNCERYKAFREQLDKINEQKKADQMKRNLVANAGWVKSHKGGRV